MTAASLVSCADTRPIVVVVDPIKGGADLRRALARSDHRVIEVCTLSPAQLAGMGLDLPPAAERLHGSDPQALADRLWPLQWAIRAVIPASEPATGCAARLAHLLRLPSNHDPDPERFRDKARMRRHAVASGVACPAFQLVGPHSPFELPAAGGPFILKPLKAAGADAVQIVTSARQAREHMQRHPRDLFGHANERWLLEEYVRGPELAINTVSAGGRHRVIDIWEYCQPGDAASAVYDNPYWNALQLPPGPVHDEAAAFAAATLDAFAVRMGFCHLEIKRDAATGRWVLIEIAARLPGAGMPWMWQRVWGLDPYRDVIDLYGGQDVPLGRYQPDPDAPLLGLVFLRSEKPGIVVQVDGVDRVRAMPEYVSADWYARPGARVQRTDSLQNPLARIMLQAPTRALLEQAAQRVREHAAIRIAPDAVAEPADLAVPA